MMETAIIGLFVVITVAGAVAAAFQRHVLYAIISMGVCLFGMAGLFLSLGSPFVAAMQILIYIGGISVAMVFAMMLSVSMSRKQDIDIGKTVAAISAAFFFLLAVAPVILGAKFPAHTPAPAESWALARIGQGFTASYNLVFEMLSLLLLVAIIGAVLIAKRDPVKK